MLVVMVVVVVVVVVEEVGGVVAVVGATKFSSSLNLRVSKFQCWEGCVPIMTRFTPTLFSLSSWENILKFNRFLMLCSHDVHRRKQDASNTGTVYPLYPTTDKGVQNMQHQPT